MSNTTQTTASNQPKPFIGQHVTELHHTDRDAWEVIQIISDRVIKIRELSAKQVKKPMNFIPGGFCGTFTDNHSQEWELTSNQANKTKLLSFRKSSGRWSEIGQNAKYSRFKLHKEGERAVKFYDYNF